MANKPPFTDNPQTSDASQGLGFTFPCEFTIKVFGASSNADLENLLLTLLHKHIPDLQPNAIQKRNSENGKYIAFSILLNVDSREQLDAIYRELSGNPDILMVL